MHLQWNFDWDETHVGRRWFPVKTTTLQYKKKIKKRFIMAHFGLHLEKYPKHASQILLSYGRNRRSLMKMTYIQVGPSKQWFIVWILPECEPDILVKAVSSCLWRQDFPGYMEKNWFYWFLWLVLSASPHPFQVLCTSETYKQRFYRLKYFQKHWILVFQVTGLKVRLFEQLFLSAEMFTILKLPNLFFSAAIAFSENMDTF